MTTEADIQRAIINTNIWNATEIVYISDDYSGYVWVPVEVVEDVDHLPGVEDETIRK